MKIKRISLSITIFITLLFSPPLYAIDYSSNCNAALSVTDPDDRYGAPAAIEAALADYTPYYNEADGVYYLNFFSATTLDMDRNFAFTVNSSETRDIYICNFNIRPTSASSTPLITITNSSNKRVYVLNSTLSNIKEGLKLIQSSGTGGFSVINTSITGDSSKSGACLNVAASGATITGGAFSNCADGIKVSASNVNISGASVHDNKYGINVDAGVNGASITDTLIYANDSNAHTTDRRLDGIYYVDSPARDLVFYDVQGASILDLSATSDVIYDYENRVPYIQLPEVPAVGNKVELFNITGDTCRNQACSKIASTELNSEEFLATGITTVDIPPEAINKNIVVIYTHPDIGSTVISKAFVTAPAIGLPEIIAFVATPYDIPTSGGNVADSGPEVGDADSGGDDDAEVQSGSDSSSGGTQMASGEGSGGGPVDVSNLTDSVGTGATGAKCSLMIGDTFRSVSIAANLWWIIFATGLLGGLRMVMVRIRKK